MSELEKKYVSVMSDYDPYGYATLDEKEINDSLKLITENPQEVIDQLLDMIAELIA